MPQLLPDIFLIGTIGKGISASMDDFERFESDLIAALLHLHDPTYHAEPLLYHKLALSSQDAVRKTLLDAIDSLRPHPETPPTSRATRMHALLDYRFVQELPQKETARRLGLSSRHLRREQQDAIRLLANRVLAMRQSTWAPAPGSAVANPAIHHSPRQPSNSWTWREQLQQELSSVSYQSPGLVADIDRAMHEVADLGKTVGFHNRRGTPQCKLVVQPCEADITAKIHPSVLQLMLITAVEKMAGQLEAGTIQMYAGHVRHWACISIEGCPVTSENVPDSEFIRETLASNGGTFTSELENSTLRFTFKLPLQAPTTVLVADDNVDLVHFYNRYVEGTQYRIVHVAEGREVHRATLDIRPEVIVLDVMLPDINGWLVLRSLRSDAQTSTIPIIVCSVVRQETLAQRLGASAYLVKPIHRHDFLQALAQVLNLQPSSGQPT